MSTSQPGDKPSLARSDKRGPLTVRCSKEKVKPSLVLLLAVAALAQVVLYFYAGAAALAFALTTGFCQNR